jgi:hypothetical protein
VDFLGIREDGFLGRALKFLGFSVGEEEDLLAAEIELREQYLRDLREQFDVEFDILRDAWDRNLISTDAFRDGMADMNAALDAAEEAVESAADESDDEPSRREQRVQRRRDRRAARRSAADGANYVTDGPEWLRVGDNASGREHVMVNPAPGSAMGTVVNINGPVFGNADDIAVEVTRMINSATRRGLVTA